MSRDGYSLLEETDWLASKPIFYNQDTGAADTRFLNVLPPRGGSLRFDPEGLFNYLDFGYSVFEQTPVANVRFLPPASRLVQSEESSLIVESLPDPVEQWWDYRISESDVIELIRSRVREWEATLPSEQAIVLPLSGGFDSRLLLWCLKDKDRVRAFTYGLSEDQAESTEVVHAKALAAHFGIWWQRIPLGAFHRYFDAWHSEFGLSTHAHGMYHLEFYKKIRETLTGRHAFLSGIYGDVWAGSVSPWYGQGVEGLRALGFTHGLRADPSKMLVYADFRGRESFWVEHMERLREVRWQVISTVRLKMILISYLLRIPRIAGFEPWSPFLSIDVAMAMLNLPQNRRENRQWQRDFFVREGLDLESQGLGGSTQNNLNMQALRRMPLKPLMPSRFEGLIEPDYVRWINRTIRTGGLAGLNRYLQGVRKVGGLLRRLGVKPPAHDRVVLEAYYAYLCLRPIDTLIGQWAEQ
jgi:hypothetical protein